MLKFCFSVITFSLVDRFTSYSHTMLLWSRPLHWYATLWPSNGRKTFIYVEKLGENYIKKSLLFFLFFINNSQDNCQQTCLPIISRLTPREFNSYGSRRGNDAVMSRGTFANIRLINKFMAKPGAKTMYLPGEEEVSNCNNEVTCVICEETSLQSFLCCLSMLLVYYSTIYQT